MVARLVLSDTDGGSNVRIELEPAELGPVEVKLSLDETGAATATFTVERPETLLLLQRDARTVAELLGAAGFSLAANALGFALRDPAERERGGAPRQGGPQRIAAGAAATPIPEPLPPVGRQALLDLRV